MFQFRFLDEESNPSKTSDSSADIAEEKWFEAKEIHPKNDFVKEISDNCVNTFKCGKNISIKHITSDAAKIFSAKVKNLPVFQAERSDSDLLTGVYEGGLKIWECTYDLANFITKQRIDLNNQTVLDLGCGSGIIGILALIKGSTVYFQDYNEEVVEFVTIPNVYLNIDITAEDNIRNKCKFYSGDWNSFLVLTADNSKNDDNKFDFIFTCETIYNINNYKKLHAVFTELLKPNGVIYLAAKTYYFGVGGGLREFEDFMIQQNVFDFSTCWKCSEGLQREILKITFKS
ncbi:hypothetical protein ILUMI_13621 [Ignelater luminosus]|uniref:protein-histidine N-methyltransferase n=1 Tax=Ignelater luminosus TaxID=2038154 RepID=A0A8K0GB99_IGNLU|nr:hypothetical protein ILUMI_13621 [Ignelater luminosus]